MKAFIPIILIVVFSIVVAFVMDNKHQKARDKTRLIEHKIRENELTERYKVLQDSVADLEQKARILNRYLNMKHLEYIEVCNLVAKEK